ncbi:MAG: hypothetical protein JHD16_00235 [Solirubrobacteraceae bacterium]|nr:hypothetical protein [Solirubrobacteraceae bacterium]
MKLYCAGCNAVHKFTAGEVEQIVYALQAAEADQRTETNGPQRHDAGKDSMGQETCLKIALDWAGTGSEVYPEYVQNLVENRRLVVRSARRDSLAAAQARTSGGTDVR